MDKSHILIDQRGDDFSGQFYLFELGSGVFQGGVSLGGLPSLVSHMEAEGRDEPAVACRCI